jgi:hypothetical protein
MEKKEMSHTFCTDDSPNELCPKALKLQSVHYSAVLSQGCRSHKAQTQFLTCPVQSQLLLAEQMDIKRIQRSVAHIILGHRYLSYKEALKTLNLESLQGRRSKLCLKFARKSEKNVKFEKWIKQSYPKPNKRQEKFKYCDVVARHTRFEKSPLSSLTKMLNQYYKKK